MSRGIGRFARSDDFLLISADFTRTRTAVRARAPTPFGSPETAGGRRRRQASPPAARTPEAAVREPCPGSHQGPLAPAVDGLRRANWDGSNASTELIRLSGKAGSLRRAAAGELEKSQPPR